ncbi:uncharacterized protein LOC120572847 isoform X4 [Perca fluviatilis]|uniref:uncharacterized protein LOC120572847 isoform X4 n=1 Tax=Perca fluviatilis TaxID=8168 RepID=UPI0019635A1A|nr:uncharacterized protein LOC120572847 isoform X4 [Perca fluviatilis]
MVLENKTSARVEAGQRRVLDEATRQRRLTRQLEALEKDNFQKRRKKRGDHFKQRFRKNFTTLLEEETLSRLQEVTVTPLSPRQPEELHTECRNRFGSHGEDGVFSSPSSPSSSSPSSPPSSTGSPSSYSSSPPPSGDSKRDRLSLSSPELLSELKQSRSRSLRRVPAHNGMTTVFRGRGRGGQALGPAPSTGSANQKTGGRETDRRSDHRT